MEYKKIECNSYNIHLIQTDHFKTVQMEIIFRCDATKENLAKYSLLTDIITDNNGIYKTRKDLAIKLEELYNMTIYGVTTKVGREVFTSVTSTFIDPKFVKDKNYLEEAIKTIMECITKPNAKNREFDLTTFNVCKKRQLCDIEAVQESLDRVSLINALKKMDDTSPTSFPTLGTKEIAEKFTPENIYDAYLDLYQHMVCDIFLVGDVNEEYAKLIKKYFKNRVIKQKKDKLYVENKIRKKPLVVHEHGTFNQSNLVMIYSITEKYDNEKIMKFHALNSILCNSGLTSILYQKLREENSLCYGVRSLYLKYDQLLVIQVNLSKENISKAKKLIMDIIKDISKGKIIGEEEVEEAKRNLKFWINSSKDNNVSILNKYVFHEIDNTPLDEEKLAMVENIKLNDIYNIAKTLKLNTVYVLSPGDKNE